VDSLGKHLHSSQDSLLEWKRRLEAREDELSVARSAIAALEARNLELEGRSANHEKELSEALKSKKFWRQGPPSTINFAQPSMPVK
jgi:hypothetical protein